MLELDLPYAPSVNHYYAGGRSGQRYLPETIRRYRAEVGKLFLLSKGRKQEGRLALFVVAFPKDRRKRDLDNLFKGLLDAMQHAGIYDDDHQIAAINARWEFENGEIKRHPEGLIHIRIVQAGG